MRMRSSRPRSARPASPYSSVYLANELSQSINRVRQAYGSIPMGPLAERLEIKQAEAHIERSADRLLKGQLDRLSWHQALCQYEQTWLMLLDELHRLETSEGRLKDSANLPSVNSHSINKQPPLKKDRHAA